MKLNQKGSSAVEILIVIVVVGLLGVVGWLVYRLKTSKTPGTINTQKQNMSEKTTEPAKAETSDHTTLKLANNKVTFEMPKTWIVGKSTCIDSPGAVPACTDGATLMPPEKIPTIYGSGTEFFTIYAQVYENKDNKTAQRWFEDVYDGGSAGSSDKVSSESINGYNTYYFRQISKSLDAITYIYSSGGKIVLIAAPVLQQGFASDGSGKVNARADFTRYIPDIEKLAKSVKIY